MAGLCCGLFSIAGIVLGFMALKQIETTGQQGRGLAIGGMVAGGVCLAINLLIVMASLVSR